MVVQRGGGCPVPADCEGQGGSGPGQPDGAVLSLCPAESWNRWLLKVPSNAKDSITEI